MTDCRLVPDTGYYTCVEVIFTLRRQVGFYMMGVYAPTLLIVVLSWLSFWINPDASAARVPLGEDHSINAPRDLRTLLQTRSVTEHSLLGVNVLRITRKAYLYFRDD